MQTFNAKNPGLLEFVAYVSYDKYTGMEGKLLRY